MQNYSHSVLVVGIVVATQSLILATRANAGDTDGDGLLDLLDVAGFDSSAVGELHFLRKRIEDLDGASQLTDATELDLSVNQISSIESGDFDGLANLRRLDLDHNQIMSIESHDFDGLANLRTLRLGRNQITSIERGGFDGLASLEVLSLDGNQITRVEAGDFDGLANLRELGLEDNHITSLESGGFDGLANLNALHLNFNQIASIGSRAFHGLTKLDALYLERNRITSIESHDFDGLANLRYLFMDHNQITSIESGDFDEPDVDLLSLNGNQITSIESRAFFGLEDLRELNLNGNQITSIESGTFDGLVNLVHLGLAFNDIAELNFAGATFESLKACSMPLYDLGFCIDSSEITSLFLDDAELSLDSFHAIIGETHAINDASLVGLTFSDLDPVDLADFLGIDTLDNLTVDRAFFDSYANELSAFAAMEGNTLMVVPGLCDTNRDGSCNAADIDTMSENVLAGANTPSNKVALIERPFPNGFNTYIGDSNLDGEFNSGDLVAVFQSGEYRDGIAENSGWAEGDWDGDAEFDSGDLVLAFQDGGFEQGRRVAVNAVPEPTSFLLLLIAGLVGIAIRRRYFVNLK